jgi:hypothetical protein
VPGLDALGLSYWLNPGSNTSLGTLTSNRWVPDRPRPPRSGPSLRAAVLTSGHRDRFSDCLTFRPGGSVVLMRCPVGFAAIAPLRIWVIVAGDDRRNRDVSPACLTGRGVRVCSATGIDQAARRSLYY